MHLDEILSVEGVLQETDYGVLYKGPRIGRLNKVLLQAEHQDVDT